MEALVEAWKNLKVNEEDDLAIPAAVDEGNKTPVHLNLCLVGKLLTSKNFNSAARKNSFTLPWPPEHGLAIREVGKNLFTFQFFDNGDMQFVLDRGPWCFDDFPLLLNFVGGNIWISETHFTLAPFGIVANDTPMRCRNEGTIKAIGNKIGLGGRKSGVGIQYDRLPTFCYVRGRRGHQAKHCSEGGVARENNEDVKAVAEATERSNDNPLHDVWLHALKGRRLLRFSRFEQARDFAWLGMLKDTAFETRNIEDLTSMGIVTFEKACTTDTIPKRNPLNAEAKFSHFSPVQSQNRPTSEQIHLEANLQSQYVATGFNEDIETEVAQSNTPTAHALRAWAWSNGRSGGIGFWWRWGSLSRVSFSLRHILVVVSVDVVCFEAIRWVSILLLDYGKSDRDLLPHCCSESIDPSVNGCTSRQ